MTAMARAQWVGGPLDGTWVAHQQGSTEYAAAFDVHGVMLRHPKAQDYLTRPEFWLRDLRSHQVHIVRVYPIVEGRILYSTAGVREVDRG